MTIEDNSLFVSKLSLERCQGYLAHLRALVHLCRIDDRTLDDFALDSVQQIISFLEREMLANVNIVDNFLDMQTAE